ncbi:hypothetical protein NIES2135_12040 [Leptolyngbya boryana NIES-2135]|uniref:Polymerase nucleotidyl transferase domain-containing protein n=2 Tax=Leptolyngbya group TaxID=3081713 RepID=A0A1Z4JD49_LEPBY|nr:hypothetical protein NIES2135_12040 [Leptolyngbya boryana NIES-2135]
MIKIWTMIELQPDLQTVLRDRLQTTQARIAELCQRWQIQEFAIFGSVLRKDFRPNSDVDVLITFAPQHPWNLFDFMDLQRELEALFGRSVDLIQKKELQNPYRRANILQSHRIIYAE